VGCGKRYQAPFWGAGCGKGDRHCFGVWVGEKGDRHLFVVLAVKRVTSTVYTRQHAHTLASSDEREGRKVTGTVIGSWAAGKGVRHRFEGAGCGKGVRHRFWARAVKRETP